MNILSGCYLRTDSPYVFSTHKNRPIAGYIRAKQVLDTRMVAKTEIGPWDNS
jgi:hypothetical protein